MKGGCYDLEDLIRLAKEREAMTEELKEPLEPLTPREKEVFFCLCDGLKNKATGQKLNISPRTVETHRARILRKLGVSSVAALVRFAVRNNLVFP